MNKPGSGGRAQIMEPPIGRECPSRQGALEEQERHESLHRLDDPAVMGVAGLSPLQLFGQSAFENDLSQRIRLLPPTLGGTKCLINCRIPSECGHVSPYGTAA